MEDLLDLQTQVRKIVCHTGEDAGVILVDDSSPTHWDEELKISIYDKENFSDLGNALVKLSNSIDEVILRSV